MRSLLLKIGLPVALLIVCGVAAHAGSPFYDAPAGAPAGVTDISMGSGKRIFLDDGSDSDPSLTCVSDPDAGMYCDGTQVLFSTGGANRLTLDASGRIISGGEMRPNLGVRIGATAPFYWVTRAEIRSPADEQVQICNAAETQCAVLDVDSANTFVVRDGAGTGSGNFQVTGNIIGGSSSLMYWSARAQMSSASRNDWAVNIGNTNAKTQLRAMEESVTFPADPGAASQVTTGSVLPGGAMIQGVTGRVTTANTGGCTAFDVGDGVDVDLFADDIATTLSTTFDTTDATAQYSTIANGHWPMTSAGEITVTAVGGDGNCDDMVVRLTVHYLMPSAATTN